MTPKVGDMPGKYIREEHLWKRELQGQKPWGTKVLCILKNYKPSVTVAERKRHQSGMCEVSLRDIASWHQESHKTLPRVLDIVLIVKKPFEKCQRVLNVAEWECYYLIHISKSCKECKYCPVVYILVALTMKKSTWLWFGNSSNKTASCILSHTLYLTRIQVCLYEI